MELRPGYKRTEVGVIPDDWEVRRVADVVDVTRAPRYGIVQPGAFDSRGCLMLRSQDYSKGWVGPDDMHRVNRQLEIQYRNARIRSNDLLITVVGAGIGQVVSAPEWLDGALLSRSTARVAVDDNRACPAFVKASLESPVGRRQIRDCQKEGAQPVVSCQDLALFSLPYPPLPEQRAIAEALSDVDALVGALERLIAKKRDLKQATMQQLLTGQTRLPGFSGEWVQGALSYVISALDAGVSVNSLDESDGGSEEACVLKTSAVADGRFLPHESKRIAARDIRRARLNPQCDTLLISRMNTPDLVGECGYVDREYPKLFIPDRLWMTRFRSGCVSARWLGFLLSSPPQRSLIAAAATGTSGSMKNLSKAAFLSLAIAYPSVREQTAIAAVLADMDAEIIALEQRRDKTRLLKQGMMQELLTGRTRLV